MIANYCFGISICVLALLCRSLPAQGGFTITSIIESPEAYTAKQRELLDANLDRAERLWESVILGYEGDNRSVDFKINVVPVREGLASAESGGFQRIGEKVIATNGTIFLNVDEITNVVEGTGINPGVNVFDELLAHELGHALGIGTLWNANGLYVNGTGEYMGEYALSAYQSEFDPNATFVPVELAGSLGSSDSHWNQLFRSSPQEGNPADPLSLSPLTGLTDNRGRDFAQDMMSPALDADFGEPFLSNTTVQAMRDLGFAVVSSFPFAGDIDGNGFIETSDVDAIAKLVNSVTENDVYDINGDGAVDLADRTSLIQRILGINFGDANQDHVFDSSDLVLVSQAAEYRDDEIANSTWETGDWDGDLEFDTGDLLLAFQTGDYEADRRAHAVPEPTVPAALIWGMYALLLRFCNRTSHSS